MSEELEDKLILGTTMEQICLTKDNVKELVEYIINLREENKQLQEQLNVLKSNYNGTYNFITELNKLCELDEDTLEEDLYSYIKQSRGRIDKAIKLIFEYGQIDGSYHKAWVIDQVTRILLGNDYKEKINEFMFGGKDYIEAINSGEYYAWDIGIAP